MNIEELTDLLHVLVMAREANIKIDVVDSLINTVLERIKAIL